MAVCSYVPRSGGPPSLVAMLPQKPGYETADDNTVRGWAAACVSLIALVSRNSA
jgi:hypothetical protein